MTDRIETDSDFMEALGELVEKAQLAGVHPGELASAMAFYTGLMLSLVDYNHGCFSLDSIIDEIRDGIEHAESCGQ